MADIDLTPTPEVTPDPTPAPTSLIDVVATPTPTPTPDPTPEVTPDPVPDPEPKPEGDDRDTNVDVEEAIENFGDLMEEGKLNEILGDFNKGNITGKALISKILNEVGIAKDEMESKIDGEIEAVRQSLKDKPIEGIDPIELGGWVSKQGQEMVDIATTLTDFSLGEPAVRSAIALLNKVRMGNADVGDPDITIVQKTSVTRDSLRDEYSNIYQTKEGMERVLGIENLIKKAEKTGDEELISWAKDMFN